MFFYNKDNKNKYYTLFRFFLSYIMVLTIPISISTLIYREAVRVVEADARNLNIQILEQTRDVLDERLRENDELIRELALNYKVFSLMNIRRLSEGSPDNFKVWDLMNYMKKYKVTNEFISEIFVFFKNGIAVSSSSAFINIPFFYERSFKTGNMDYNQWNDIMWAGYHCSEFNMEDIIINGIQKVVIQKLQSIPLYSYSHKGVIMVLIDKETICRYLDRVDIGSKGGVYIIDNYGKVITSISGVDHEIFLKDILNRNEKQKTYMTSSNEELIVSKVSSSFNGWKYISVTPSSYVLQKVSYIKNITTILVLFSIILGLIVSYILSYSYSKPVKKMLNTIMDLFGSYPTIKSNPYNYIESALTSLIKRNKSLQDEIIKQLSILKVSFTRRLFNGEFHDQGEIDTFCTNVDIKISGRNYVVVIVRVDGYLDLINKEVLNELNLDKVVIKDILNTTINEKCIFYDIDEKKIAILISFSDSNSEKCKEKLKEIIGCFYEKISKIYNMRLFISVGNIYTDIIKISKSYEEAMQVIEYKDFDSFQREVWFEDIEFGSKEYYYPIDIELRLISCVKFGDKNQVKEILKSIYKKNFNNASLPLEMSSQLIYAMKGTLIRLSKEIKLSEQIEFTIHDIEKAETINEIFNIFTKDFLIFCDIITEHKEYLKEEFKKKVYNYIENNYMDENLNIYKLSVYFDVTEAYMYEFFKRYMETTFAKFLEKIRIEKACEFLSQSDNDIKNIAKVVGYTCDHTFRRAFKRMEGICPKDYRGAVRKCI